MDITSFISKKASPILHTTSWKAPSNIALVKYWGKYGEQLPKNPSLSFTYQIVLQILMLFLHLILNQSLILTFIFITFKKKILNQKSLFF
tara:strand:- start:242 stop:511 length:270 start_codon:yes stop_codon:yes gene_type:complete